MTPLHYALLGAGITAGAQAAGYGYQEMHPGEWTFAELTYPAIAVGGAVLVGGALMLVQPRSQAGLAFMSGAAGAAVIGLGVIRRLVKMNVAP